MKYDIVIIGSSQGALPALEVVFEKLAGASFPPLVLVLHRADGSGSALKNLLDRRLPIEATEPNDKDPLEPNRFYVAPAGYHLLVDKDGFHLSVDAPVSHSRPSIDVLFESAAHAFKERALGVILTSGSADGAEGAAVLAEHGGLVLVQEPKTAENACLPKAALERLGSRARILTLEEIGAALAACEASKGKIL